MPMGSRPNVPQHQPRVGRDQLCRGKANRGSLGCSLEMPRKRGILHCKLARKGQLFRCVKHCPKLCGNRARPDSASSKREKMGTLRRGLDKNSAPPRNNRTHATHTHTKNMLTTALPWANPNQACSPSSQHDATAWNSPLMRKKKAPVSLATARAMRVFPVPGGP